MADMLSGTATKMTTLSVVHNSEIGLIPLNLRSSITHPSGGLIMASCGKITALQNSRFSLQESGRFAVPPSGSCRARVSVAGTETYCHEGASKWNGYCISGCGSSRQPSYSQPQPWRLYYLGLSFTISSALYSLTRKRLDDSGSLHRYQTQVAVHCHLTQTPHRDVVEGALPFETAVGSFYGLALLVQCLPSYSMLLRAIGSHELFVSPVHLNNGFGQVLVLHQLEQGLTTIASIGHDVARMKLTGREPSLPENVGGADRIVDITSADVGSDGHFRLAIHQQMQLIAVGGFFHSLSTGLDRPTSILIGLHWLAAVAPTLEGGTVQSHSFTKGGERLIVLAHQASRNILETWQPLGACQPLEEPTKRAVVGDVLRGHDPAGLSDKGIVAQGSSHRFRGGKREVVLYEKTPPEYVGLVAFRTAAGRPGKGLHEWNVVQSVKEPLEVSDDGRRLNFCAECGSLNECHGKPQPSCWLRDVVVDCNCVSAFIGTILLSYIVTVKPPSHPIVANLKRVWRIIRHKLGVSNPTSFRYGLQITKLGLLTVSLPIDIWYNIIWVLVEVRGIEPLAERSLSSAAAPSDPHESFLQDGVVCVSNRGHAALFSSGLFSVPPTIEFSAI